MAAAHVIGTEDFQWEEPYVLGGRDQREYQRLCRRQPSYRDVFSLEAITPDARGSEWAMHRDDIGARVRRKSNDREFLLGLSELELAEKASKNGQLIEAYAVWFINYK